MRLKISSEVIYFVFRIKIVHVNACKIKIKGFRTIARNNNVMSFENSAPSHKHVIHL